MIVYLDQNKWIELAKIVYGKDTSIQSKRNLYEIQAALDCGYIFPLSAIHFMEFSRIKNHERRSKLGRVMWDFSKGNTLTSFNEIVRWEIEIAFTRVGCKVEPRRIELIGKGISHAFGETENFMCYHPFSEVIDKAILCGIDDITPIEGISDTHRRNFQEHLTSLHSKKKEIDKSKWDDWLYLIAMMDIREPLYEVMMAHGIPMSEIESWGRYKIRSFLDSIPTRVVDIHLHRQVIKNSSYISKLSDLEDWAGLGLAVCYCDVVVCEKHFAHLIKRMGFKAKARVETDLSKIFSSVSP